MAATFKPVQAIRILDVLGWEQGLDVTRISRQLNFPNSKFHEILANLGHEGIVDRNTELKHVQPGLKLFELGNLARVPLHCTAMGKAILAFLDESSARSDDPRYVLLPLNPQYNNRPLRAVPGSGDDPPTGHLRCGNITEIGISKALNAEPVWAQQKK